MKKFNEYNEIEQIKIKKILIYNNDVAEFKISNEDIVEFNELFLSKIVHDNKEYLFRDNIMLNS